MLAFVIKVTDKTKGKHGVFFRGESTGLPIETFFDFSSAYNYLVKNHEWLLSKRK
jgi:hypothetical protein